MKHVRTEIDIGITILAALALSLLLVMPVRAQSIPTAQIAVGSNDVTQSQLAAYGVAVVLALISGNGILYLVINDRFKKRDVQRQQEVQGTENLTELIKAINTLGTSISSVLDDQSQERKEQLSQRAIVATSQKDLATIMSGMLENMKLIETQVKAQERSDAVQAHSDTNTEKIIANDNAKFAMMDGKIDSIIQTLEAARKEALTKEVLNNTINPLILKIDAAIMEMRLMKAPAAPLAPEQTQDPNAKLNGGS